MIKKVFFDKIHSVFVATFCVLLFFCGTAFLFAQSKPPAATVPSSVYTPFGSSPQSSGGTYIPFPEKSISGFNPDTPLPPPSSSANSSQDIAENLINELASPAADSQADSQTAIAQRELAAAEIQKNVTENLFEDQARDSAIQAEETPFSIIPSYEEPYYRPPVYEQSLYDEPVVP